MLKRIKTNKKKGFTLIELIVVMAVLAILVLLAAPKFLGHTKEAQFTKHINNAKVLEDASERYYIDHGQWPRGADEDVYTAEEVDAYAERIYDITGKELELVEGKYWDIDYEALTSYAKLPDTDERANYVLRNPVGTVYYLEELTEAGEARLPDSDGQTPSEPETPKELTPEEIAYNEWVKTLKATGYVMATDGDFEKDAEGNWHYTGSDDYVILPNEVQGETLTSYAFMFRGGAYQGVTSSGVKGVASKNTNIVDMNGMFMLSKSTTLDLSHFYTSQVTNMNYMFYGNEAATLDLTSFDTSRVSSMFRMFAYSKADRLNISSFNTSQVANMNSMFSESYASMLNLSSFDTSKVNNMGNMFSNSHATILDLTNFNTSQVTNMHGMFWSSQATKLNLTSFNTSQVTSMYAMFSHSQAATLDLSSFNMANVDNVTSMFQNAVATTGYARTSSDRTKFLQTATVKPNNLTFTVK